MEMHASKDAKGTKASDGQQLIGEAADTPPPLPGQHAVEKAVLPKAKTTTCCTNCGSLLVGDAAFCTECGTSTAWRHHQKAADTSSDAALRMLIPIGQSLYAIVAGYLGLSSVLIIPAPFAIIFGLLAIRDISKNPGKHGKGRAYFGIIMGVLGSIVGAVLILGAVVAG